jgi:hypothetical protein
MSLFGGSSLFSEDDDDSSFSNRPAAGYANLKDLFPLLQPLLLEILDASFRQIILEMHKVSKIHISPPQIHGRRPARPRAAILQTQKKLEIFFLALTTRKNIFHPCSKSKLGNLFGGEAAKPAGNESLQYNRPKQPKKDSPAPTGASKKAGASPPAAAAPTYPAILSAVGATLYKLYVFQISPPQLNAIRLQIKFFIFLASLPSQADRIDSANCFS